jgi:hypothetical protein
MNTKIWFEIWNVTNSPYRVNSHTKYASEMEAEITIPMFEKPRPNESDCRYEIRQVVETTNVVNTISVAPRAIMSIEEIADNAISDAMGRVRFDIESTEDYDLLSQEDQIKVNDLFNAGADCCNTCGIYVEPEELDEEGDCDDCVTAREEDEEWEDEEDMDDFGNR